MIKGEYSHSELKLIVHFGFSDLVNSNLSENSMYQLMVNKAFETNDQSGYAKALRDAYKAFRDRTHTRMTKEFNNLIEDQLYWS